MKRNKSNKAIMNLGDLEADGICKENTALVTVQCSHFVPFKLGYYNL